MPGAIANKALATLAGALAPAALLIAAFAPAGASAAPIKRTVPLDGKVTQVRMAVHHKSGSQPPAILLSTAPRRVDCAANGFRYTSHNRQGRLRVTLTCSDLSENSRAEFKIRRPYAREVAISDGTGKVRLKLDKPAGDAVPLVGLTTEPKGTNCETTPRSMHVGRDEFRATASVTCNDLPRNARGELAVGGLLAPNHIDLQHREPTRADFAAAEAAASSEGAERARKPCDDPYTVSLGGGSVTKQVCYTEPTRLGPWQSWFIGSGPRAASAPCVSPWYAHSLLNVVFPVSLDVDPYSGWYSYYFGVVTNWRAWTDVDFSFAYSCYQSTPIPKG